MDRSQINDLKGKQIKEMFLVAHSSNTYVRFLLSDGTAFDVSHDAIFDIEGNRFDQDELRYRL